MVSREGIIATYMMASRKHGTIYIGVTSDLITRASQHREAATPGFTARHHVDRLVWYEPFDMIVDAIRREKQLKKYKREWKINLIERDNPNWDDLLPELLAWRPGNPWGQSPP